MEKNSTLDRVSHVENVEKQDNSGAEQRMGQRVSRKQTKKAALDDFRNEIQNKKLSSQKLYKDTKVHFSKEEKSNMFRKNPDYGFKDTVSFSGSDLNLGSKPADKNKKGEQFQKRSDSDSQSSEKDLLKTRKRDDKISSKATNGASDKGKNTRKSGEGARVKNAIRRRKFAFMVNKLTGDQEKDSFGKLTKDILLMRAGLVIKHLFVYLLGLLGPLLGGLVTIALPFILIIVILYNSPLALFLPPLTEGETVQSVLSQYYQDFNAEIREAEEDSEQDVTYKNMLNGVARSNFTDVMMVYMVQHGTGKRLYGGASICTA